MASINNLKEVISIAHSHDIKVVGDGVAYMAHDIIDLKDPSKGALGKLNNSDIEEIINFIAKKKLTSSTKGDLPNNKELISKNVSELSVTDNDFIKIGVFDNNYIKT